MCYEEIDYDQMKTRMNDYLQGIGEAYKLDIKFCVSIIDDPKILQFNAFVHKKDENEYEICFYKSLFDCIRSSVSFYLNHVIESDLDFMEIEGLDIPTGNYSGFFPCNNLVNSFYNYIASLILDNVVRHEVGHVILGHCDGNGIYSEKGSYETSKSLHFQSCEMQADWYGVFRGLTANLDFAIFSKDFNIYHSYEYRIINRLYLCYFIAVYVQYSLFFNNFNWSKRNLKEIDFINRKHACDLVRLKYSYYALIYTLQCLLIETKGINETDAFDYAFGMADAFKKKLDFLLASEDRFTFEDVLEDRHINFYYMIVMSEYFSRNDYKAKLDFNIPLIPTDELIQYLYEDAVLGIYENELTDEEKAILGR